MAVFFVSREPVRAPQPLADFAAVARGLADALPGKTLAGSLSVAFQDRFVIAACPNGLGSAPESSLVEVYEYDPIRYQALVIGLVEPPAATPVHWIARRVNPAARVVAVVDGNSDIGRPLEVLAAPKGYLGNADTLLALGRSLKGRQVCAVEGLGVVAVGVSPQAVVDSLRPPAPTA